MRIRGEMFGRFRTTFERGGVTYKAVWWQAGARILREHYRVIDWHAETLPSV